MNNQHDTIAAIATAPGLGGIGIIRLSGPETEPILRAVFRSARDPSEGLKSHQMTYGYLTDGEQVIDECMAVLMRAPRSYTREDVGEIQTHGGSYVLHRSLELCLREGARLAEPGEFTRRAFMNGRIDLSSAEAVMSLIAARGEQDHRAAVQQMQGGTARFVRECSDRLYQLQAGLAACLDYPEEISEEEGTGMLEPGIRKLAGDLKNAVDERGARLIRDGLQVVLIGRPNVGKSSLLNALLGEERAIVTEIPGTTRDVIGGEIVYDGIRVVLTDTAGQRETEDPVEKIGVERSRRAVMAADLAVLVTDGSENWTPEDEKLLEELPAGSLVLINKSDLPAKLSAGKVRERRQDVSCLSVSALRPETLEQVKAFIREMTEGTDRVMMTQPRHLEAVKRAVRHLEDALATLRNATVDLAATDLEAAQEALGEITGDRVDERLLDAVFSQFCVGK